MSVADQVKFANAPFSSATRKPFTSVPASQVTALSSPWGWMRKELRLPSWMPPSPPSTTTSKPSAALALGRSGRNANAASKAREGLTYFHLCERSNVILVSGYLGFAARREGASLVHASLLALLSAAVLQALVAGGTVWLSGTPNSCHRTGYHGLGSGVRGRPVGSPRGRPLPDPGALRALARVGCGPLTSSSSTSVLLEDAITGVFDGHCATPGGRAHPAAPVPEAPAAEGPSRAPAMTSRLLHAEPLQTIPIVAVI